MSRVINYLAAEFKGFTGIIGSLEDVVDNRIPLGEIFDLAANYKGSEKDFLTTMESALNRARQSHAGRAESGRCGTSHLFQGERAPVAHGHSDNVQSGANSA